VFVWGVRAEGWGLGYLTGVNTDKGEFSHHEAGKAKMLRSRLWGGMFWKMLEVDKSAVRAEE